MSAAGETRQETHCEAKRQDAVGLGSTKCLSDEAVETLGAKVKAGVSTHFSVKHTDVAWLTALVLRLASALPSIGIWSG